MGWYDMPENNTGALCARLSGDVSKVQVNNNNIKKKVFRFSGKQFANFSEESTASIKMHKKKLKNKTSS